MGNRATIVTKNKDVGVYLHWFGGSGDVVPVLTYCGLHAYRPPDDSGYGWARLCQVFGNYIGGTLSIGVYPYDSLPIPFDNGEYVIERWKVVDHNGHEVEPLHDDFDLETKLHDIDEHMPAPERLGKYIDGDVVPIGDVEIGTVVWGWDGDRPQRYTIIGFGPDSAREGMRGKPYVNRIKVPGEEYWQHESNYLDEDFVRIERPQSWGTVAFRSLFGRPLSQLR
jgi:hypothetical protein